MIIAVDIGNSKVKFGIFQDGRLKDVVAFLHGEMEEGIRRQPFWREIRKNLKYLGLSSVGKEEMARQVKSIFGWLGPEQVVEITHQSRLPIQNGYKSPLTLGIDRICVAVAAKELAGEAAVLAIDAGTAVTLEFVDKSGTYLGGSIAPGMKMRFRALNAFTARLPLLEPEPDPPLVGQDTASAIRSGVENGLAAELNGLIDRYREHHGNDLVVCLTGGDTEFLRNRLKYLNFADAHLLLRGIHILIHHNAQVL